VHVRFTKREWNVPVIAASAGQQFGVEAVLEAIDRHRAHLGERGVAEIRRRKRIEQVRRALAEALGERLWREKGFAERVERELGGGAIPHELTAGLLSELSAQLSRANEDPPKARR
jgi:putative protein kinase ArgK-like GTPase of G3E family